MKEHDRLGLHQPRRRQRGLAPSEVLFLLSLPVALAAVIYSGTLSFKEGQRLEVAKSNGQELVKWAETAASANEKGEPSTPQDCSAVAAADKVATSASAAEPAAAGSAVSATPAAPASAAAPSNSSASAPPSTWGKCKQALLAPGGLLAQAKNPFNPEEPVVGVKCERDKPATRGQVVVEKGTSPPAGMSGSVSYGAIEDSEPMVKGLMLKILVCDKGSYPIKVSEVKL